MSTKTKPVINLDELEATTISDMRPGGSEQYIGAAMAEIATHIGAQRLGYNLTIVPPGKRAFPAHNHYANEEMFFIIEGIGELRYGSDHHPLRQGDVIACPPGDSTVAHQIINTSDNQTLRYLAVSTMQTPDLVEYPDSGKTAAAHYYDQDETGCQKAVRILNRTKDNLDYWEGE